MLMTVAAATLSFGQAAKQFEQNCKKCHGEDGKGHTMVGRMVKAADLTSDAVQQKSDAELGLVISKGKGKMAAFGDRLGGDAGVAQVLAYVRALKK